MACSGVAKTGFKTKALEIQVCEFLGLTSFEQFFRYWLEPNQLRYKKKQGNLNTVLSEIRSRKSADNHHLWDDDPIIYLFNLGMNICESLWQNCKSFEDFKSLKLGFFPFWRCFEWVGHCSWCSCHATFWPASNSLWWLSIDLQKTQSFKYFNCSKCWNAFWILFFVE